VSRRRDICVPRSGHSPPSWREQLAGVRSHVGDHKVRSLDEPRPGSVPSAAGRGATGARAAPGACWFRRGPFLQSVRALLKPPLIDWDSWMGISPVVSPGPRARRLPIDDLVEQDHVLSPLVGGRLSIQMEVPPVDPREATLVDRRLAAAFEAHVDGASALRLDEVDELGCRSSRDMSRGLPALEAGAGDLVLERHLDERIQ
jgi:hypothetical protein